MKNLFKYLFVLTIISSCSENIQKFESQEEYDKLKRTYDKEKKVDVYTYDGNKIDATIHKYHIWNTDKPYIKESISLNDGIIDGSYKWFFPNGELESESTFNDGYITSKVKYRIDKTIKSETEYKNRKKISETIYNSDGTKKNEKSWSDEGKVITDIEYRSDGSKFEKHKFLDPDGVYLRGDFSIRISGDKMILQTVNFSGKKEYLSLDFDGEYGWYQYIKYYKWNLDKVEGIYMDNGVYRKK